MPPQAQIVVLVTNIMYVWGWLAGWCGDVTSGLPTGWEEEVGGMGKVWSQSASAVQDGSNKGRSPPCGLSSSPPLHRPDDSSCSAEVASSSNLPARLLFHATALCSCRAQGLFIADRWKKMKFACFNAPHKHI